MSLSASSGVAWLSVFVLVAGTILAALLGRRPAIAFVVAVVASVVGTPALYVSSFVPLLAVAAPITTGDALFLFTIDRQGTPAARLLPAALLALPMVLLVWMFPQIVPLT